MARQRQAGRRHLLEAKARRRTLIREVGLKLAFGSAMWLGVSALIAAWASIFYGRVGFAFFMGAGVGSLAVMGLVAFQVLDPVGSRLYAGLEGEQNTAREIRKLRRAGWRVVNNLYFQTGEVDHVAVGPGGVFVIESKSSKADFDYLVRQGQVGRWGAQASSGVVKVRGLIKTRAGHAVDVGALLVMWSPGQPDEPTTLEKGVVRVAGWDLRSYLKALPEMLDRTVVEDIARELEEAARGFDERVGLGERRRLRLRLRRKGGRSQREPAA